MHFNVTEGVWLLSLQPRPRVILFTSWTLILFCLIPECFTSLQFHVVLKTKIFVDIGTLLMHSFERNSLSGRVWKKIDFCLNQKNKYFPDWCPTFGVQASGWRSNRERGKAKSGDVSPGSHLSSSQKPRGGGPQTWVHCLHRLGLLAKFSRKDPCVSEGAARVWKLVDRFIVRN